jgi:hypothetical protein
VSGVSQADAVKLLGENPIEAAREINAARAKLGRGPALRVQVAGTSDALAMTSSVCRA